jgi:hypothetical protein
MSAAFADVASARRAIGALANGGRGRGAWTLPQVLNHLAQSVEYSMQGFPQPKPALFRATLGKAAFSVFSARGRMSHPLDAAIPGAPALAANDPLEAAITRLDRALSDFEAWQAPLHPHFAYGALTKPAYRRAHLMHIADHWSEITP